MTVGQIAHETTVVSEDESIIDTAETMDREGTGALVVEDNGLIEGIVTDREIALAVAEHDGDLSDGTVGDIMTEEPTTLNETDDSLAASKEMAQAGVRRIPVVDDSDSLAGIVTLDDVVSLTGEQLEDAATVIEKQSPGYEP